MFDSATTIGLLLTLVMIFSFQGNTILEKPLHIVLIAVPLILQTFLIFAIAYIACRVLKLPYKIAAPAGMIGASNFFELHLSASIIPAAVRLPRPWESTWLPMCLKAIPQERKQNRKSIRMLSAL